MSHAVRNLHCMTSVLWRAIEDTKPVCNQYVFAVLMDLIYIYILKILFLYVLFYLIDIVYIFKKKTPFFSSMREGKAGLYFSGSKISMEDGFFSAVLFIIVSFLL